MTVIITLPHASWYPHRSGYEASHPSYVEEYGFARVASGLIQATLQEHGIESRVLEKDHRYKCNPECDDPKKCGRYAAGLVAMTRTVRRADPELALEFHINRGPVGASGAFCITTGTFLADLWADAFLRRYTSTTPIPKYGQGVYGPRAFGRKYYLEHGAKNAVIIEVGHASSATDSEYLRTTQAIRHCVQAASAATREVISGNELASDS